MLLEWIPCCYHVTSMLLPWLSRPWGKSVDLVPFRADVKAMKVCLSQCSEHAVHVLIFKYRLKPSSKLTSYTSESAAIQTLCRAQLFSWAHWHYQILLQTNSRSSRNALGAHITKAPHWHLERKLSMLTIQIKHQQKNELIAADWPAWHQ